MRGVVLVLAAEPARDRDGNGPYGSAVRRLLEMGDFHEGERDRDEVRLVSDIRGALSALGVSPSLVTKAEMEMLDEQGYLPLEGILDAWQVATLARRFDELVSEEGERAGVEAHQEQGADRLADLVDKDPAFDLCWNNPKQLAAVSHVLGWKEFKVFSLNGRAALPSQGHQSLHVDWGSAVAPGDYQICNSIWMLDDFTTDNGATRIIPGSHRWGRLPQDDMADPRQPHPDEILLLGSAGTAVVFNSHLWHGGTQNRTDRPRRALHSAYVRRDEKQQTTFRDYLLPATYDRLSAAQRYLLEV
jgi:ectoine hydroxylase-related dioxygenase (phytanoyl-CoA dioxygenase family)